MAEFIDREKAISIIEERQKALFPVGMYGRCFIYGTEREKYDAWDEIIDALEYIPAADVEPVVHGKWCVSEYEYLDCSVCGEQMYTGCNSTKEALILAIHWKKYCPNCGAKMDLEG